MILLQRSNKTLSIQGSVKTSINSARMNLDVPITYSLTLLDVSSPSIDPSEPWQNNAAKALKKNNYLQLLSGNRKVQIRSL